MLTASFGSLVLEELGTHLEVSIVSIQDDIWDRQGQDLSQITGSFGSLVLEEGAWQHSGEKPPIGG